MPKTIPTIRFQTPGSFETTEVSNAPDMNVPRQVAHLPPATRPASSGQDLGLESYLSAQDIKHEDTSEHVQVSLLTKLISHPVVHLSLRRSSLGSQSAMLEGNRAPATCTTKVLKPTQAPSILTNSPSNHRPRLDMNDMVQLVRAEDSSEARRISNRLRQTIRSEALVKRKSTSHDDIGDSGKRFVLAPAESAHPLSTGAIDENTTMVVVRHF
jgi:hypothetical protein